MALTKCPDCGHQVSDQAVLCPGCGRAVTGWPRALEYRSKAVIWGLPLVHVVMGPLIDPTTGRFRVARGIIAVGPIAFGGLAVGGLSFGAVCFGGVAAGLLACGGVAGGLLVAVGGLAVGLVAMGGGAIGYYALGGGALGAHAFGGNRQDEEAIRFFERFLDLDFESFSQNRPK